MYVTSFFLSTFIWFALNIDDDSFKLLSILNRVQSEWKLGYTLSMDTELVINLDVMCYH